MTAPLVGETFHFTLDGTVIVGRFIEVDPPHRMPLRWDRQGTDTATSESTFIEITLTPTDAGMLSQENGRDENGSQQHLRRSTSSPGNQGYEIWKAEDELQSAACSVIASRWCCRLGS